MGDTSTEPAVKLRANKDYHVVEFKPGDWVYPGWIYRTTGLRRATNKARVTNLMVAFARGELKPEKDGYKTMYSHAFLYPGARPDPKWGPVCP